MAELIFAGNAFEFEEYKNRFNLPNAVHLSDPMVLMHVPEGTVVRAVGTYHKRMDYGQVFEICLRRKISFNG